MIKRAICFSICTILNLHVYSQSVGKYKFKGKEYLVFPYRISYTGDIPMLGYTIPDGEYIAFTTYNFKTKIGFKREKKHVLTDTTIVGGIFTIKANQADGHATFYSYSLGNRGQQYHKPYEEISGNFVNGLRVGEWKRTYIGKYVNEVKTYKDGVTDGYLFTYEQDGLVSKEKYCGGIECDTVFYYNNGALTREYDLGPENNYTNPNIYAKALLKLDIRLNKAKTYYKEYNWNGKLYLDIKLKDGEVLPFDSICSNEFHLSSPDYVTIKKVAENQQVLTHFSGNKYRQTFSKQYLEDDFVYRKTVTSYWETPKRKWLFGKRYLVKDTTVSEETFVNPKTLTDSSIVPVLVYKLKENNRTDERYYIPKYKFIFYSYETRPVFNKIDTVLHRIHINRYRSNYFSKYRKQNEMICFNNKQQARLNDSTRAFLRKEFIVPQSVEDFENNVQHYERRLENFRTEPYTTYETKNLYYRSDTLLNGIYCFSISSKPKKAPKEVTYTYGSGLEEDIAIGKFVNGIKEGTWKNLYYSDAPKRVPLDLKAYFFAHKKRMEGYKESEYKDGMLDGLSVFYNKYDPKRNDRSSKEPTVLYKSTELNYVRDTLNGNCKMYFHTGKLSREVNYIMGSPDGEYRQYFEDGNLAVSIQFKKGKLEGPYKVYASKGLQCSAFFKNNHLKDSIIYYYNTGKPSLALYTKNDTLLRKIDYYYEGGIKEDVLFDNSSKCMLSAESMASESFIEILKGMGDSTLIKANGVYKNYYDNGQLLTEGSIKQGRLKGHWKFYSINGVMIHEVNFVDTLIKLPGSEEPKNVYGIYNGYYNNGVKRCLGYIKDIDLSYDCFTKQDKADFDFYALDFYDITGKQTLKNGNGYFIKYDANGLRLASGKLKNCMEDSLWRYYTPEQKLKEIGNYVNREKEGVWYVGSLEGINFEDGACFDMNDPEAVKEFNEKRKSLNIIKTIYKNGVSIETSEFNSNINKTYDSRREMNEIEY